MVETRLKTPYMQYNCALLNINHKLHVVWWKQVISKSDIKWYLNLKCAFIHTNQALLHLKSKSKRIDYVLKLHSWIFISINRIKYMHLFYSWYFCDWKPWNKWRTNTSLCCDLPTPDLNFLICLGCNVERKERLFLLAKQLSPIEDS